MTWYFLVFFFIIFIHYFRQKYLIIREFLISCFKINYCVIKLYILIKICRLISFYHHHNHQNDRHILEKKKNATEAGFLYWLRLFDSFCWRFAGAQSELLNTTTKTFFKDVYNKRIRQITTTSLFASCWQWKRTI